MLLAIDTSGVTGVAVLDDAGETLSSRTNEDLRGHAEDIGPLIVGALADAGDPAVDLVAYGVGPGPYTGLRVGMAAARAFALATGATELPVLSHDAMALTAVRQGVPFPFAVVTDAKRRESYWTVYAGVDAAGLPAREGEPHVGADLPPIPLARYPLHAPHLGRIALLRRAAGVAPEPPEARYLRAADVTPAPAKGVGA